MRILTYPDPRLRQIAEPVDDVDDDLQKTLDSMYYAMIAHRGIGLAATQLGIPKRLIVIDLSSVGITSGPMYLVNPEIIRFSTEKVTESEGCLSFPQCWGKVERSKDIDVRYLNYNGDQITIEATGLMAACIQHEVEHLDGILFHDHLSKMKKKMNERKLRKLGVMK